MDRRRFLLMTAGLVVELSAAPNVLASSGSPRPIGLVTADREAHVVALNLVDGRTVARAPTLAGPRSIEAVAGGALVAHTQIGRVSLLDAETLSVRRIVDGFRAPRYTAASRDPREALAYVTDSSLGEVVTVDL